MNWRRVSFAAVSSALVTFVGMQQALAEYPEKPIRLIVPFAQGGATDQTAQMIARPLEKALGQRVIIVNQPGAGGAVGLAQAARARPDGYTLAMVTDSSLTARPLMSDSGYQPDSFISIARLVEIPTGIAIGKGKFESLKALVAAGKQRPLTFSSPGVGSGPDLMVAAFADQFDFKVSQVPAGSGREALLKLMSGEVDFVAAGGSNFPSMLDEKEGAIEVLALAGEESWPFLPKVPTFKEAGYDFLWSQWFGIVAPADTPDEIVGLISAEVEKIMGDPANEGLLKRFYFFNAYLGPKDFDALIKENTERLKPLLKQLGMAKQ